MSNQVNSLIRRFLVHDEVESFPRKSKYPLLSDLDLTCRIRVWRSADIQSIVLVSQTDWKSPLDFMSTTFAQYVSEAILKYDESGMAYFQDSIGFTRRNLTLIHFEYAGSELRRRPFNPQRTPPRAWEEFEAIIGGTVER